MLCSTCFSTLVYLSLQTNADDRTTERCANCSSIGLRYLLFYRASAGCPYRDLGTLTTATTSTMRCVNVCVFVFVSVLCVCSSHLFWQCAPSDVCGHSSGGHTERRPHKSIFFFCLHLSAAVPTFYLFSREGIDGGSRPSSLLTK